MGKHALPEEIWIIQVNRVHHAFVPETPSDIFDRRNQLAGNISLQHELDSIEIVNMLHARARADGGVPRPLRVGHDRSPIKVRFIRMSEELQESLDYPSKLSRAPEHIAPLIADGEAQAGTFLDELGQRAEPDAPEALVESVAEQGPMGPI